MKNFFLVLFLKKFFYSIQTIEILQKLLGLMQNNFLPRNYTSIFVVFNEKIRKDCIYDCNNIMLFMCTYCDYNIKL